MIGAEAERRGAPILDVSATGVRLALDGERLATALERPFVFDLGPFGRFEARLDVARTEAEGIGDGRVVVGASFTGPTPSDLGVLSRFVLDRVLSEARSGPLFEEGLKSVLGSPPGGGFEARTTDVAGGQILHTRRSSISLCLSNALIATRGPIQGLIRQHGGGGRSYPFSLISFPHDTVMDLLVGSTDMPFQHGDIEVVLRAVPSPIYFRTEAERASDGLLRLALPHALREFGFRSSRRARLEPSTRLLLRASHPRLADREVTKSVLEVSAGGFSFELRPDEDVLFPEDLLDSVEIDLPDPSSGSGSGRRCVRASGVLRNMSVGAEGIVKCGVELIDFASAADSASWAEFAFGVVHPRINVVRGDDVHEAWTALEDAEYVGKWTSAEHERHLHQCYHSAWSKVSALDGYAMVMNEGEKRDGTVAANLLYPRAWILHHLAIHRASRNRPKKFFEIARELYTALTYMIQHLTEMEYFIAYFAAETRWGALLYDDFLERYSDKDAFLLTRRDAYRCLPTDDLVASLPSAGGTTMRVRIATDEDLLVVSDYLRSTLPAGEFDAFAFGAEEISLREFSKTCAARQYERHRAIYVAEFEGKLVSAAMAESGDEGINVFGLLNIAWVHDLVEGPWTERARAALSSELIRHYHARGVQLFVLTEPETKWRSTYEAVGFQYASPGIRWIAHRSMVPAWQSHLESTLLDARRALRSGRTTPRTESPGEEDGAPQS